VQQEPFPQGEGSCFYVTAQNQVHFKPTCTPKSAMTTFAANFIRWATVWIEQHAEQDENTLPVGKLGIKKQVKVTANTSVKVIHNSGCILLRFNLSIVFAGK
jgi:hypothetical protein